MHTIHELSQIESLLDSTTGTVETEIDTLTDTNEFSESRIEEMLVRLDIQRKDLLARFIRMEVALATANRILDSSNRRRTRFSVATSGRQPYRKEQGRGPQHFEIHHPTGDDGGASEVGVPALRESDHVVA